MVKYEENSHLLGSYYVLQSQTLNRKWHSEEVFKMRGTGN